MNWDEPVISDDEEDNNVDMKATSIIKNDSDKNKPSKLKDLLSENKTIAKKTKVTKKPQQNKNNNNPNDLIKPNFTNNNINTFNNNKPLDNYTEEKQQNSNLIKEESISKPNITGSINLDSEEYKIKEKPVKKVEEEVLEKHNFTNTNKGGFKNLDTSNDVSNYLKNQINLKYNIKSYI